MERDPVEYFDSPALYQAIGLSPLNFTDPDGQVIRETVGIKNHKNIQRTKRRFMDTVLGRNAWETLDNLTHWTRTLGVDFGKIAIDWSIVLPSNSTIRDREGLGQRLHEAPSIITVMLRSEDDHRRNALGHIVEDLKFGHFGGLASVRIKFGKRFGTAGDRLPPPYYWFGRLLERKPARIKQLHNYAHEIGHAYGVATNEQYRAFKKDMERFNKLRQQTPPGQKMPDPIRAAALRGKKAVEDFAEMFALMVVTGFETGQAASNSEMVFGGDQ